MKKVALKDEIKVLEAQVDVLDNDLSRALDDGRGYRNQIKRLTEELVKHEEANRINPDHLLATIRAQGVEIQSLREELKKRAPRRRAPVKKEEP